MFKVGNVQQIIDQCNFFNYFLIFTRKICLRQTTCLFLRYFKGFFILEIKNSLKLIKLNYLLTRENKIKSSSSCSMKILLFYKKCLSQTTCYLIFQIYEKFTTKIGIKSFKDVNLFEKYKIFHCSIHILEFFKFSREIFV